MVSSARVGIAFMLVSFVACTDATTAPTAPATTDPPPATTHLAARPFVSVTLGDLGGGSAIARGINSFGVVVGSSMTAGGELHAFIWTRNRGMHDLGTLPGETRSDAAAVNLLGESVGTSGEHAVRWDRFGRIKLLRAPGATLAAATDINVTGVVSGWAVYPETDETPRLQLPVIWNRDGVLISLGVPEPQHEGEAVAINDIGLVAATVGADIIHLTRAAVWHRRSGWRILEPQIVDARAEDLNLRGDVVGMDLREPGIPAPILWRRDGSFHELSPQGGDVRGINLLGQMVGRAVLEDGGFRLPVMWNRDLTIVPLPVREDASSVVNAISDLGEIVGGIGSEAVIWTRYPGSIRQRPDVVAARVAGAAASAAAAALPAWLIPEHRRCTRRVGPLLPGEPTCSSAP